MPYQPITDPLLGDRQSHNPASPAPLVDFATPSGFKALPNDKFIAWYTNAYQDRDNEWFAEKAIDADLERMTSTGDYPELQFFHIPQTKFGQVTHVFKAGRFAVALGKTDGSPLANALLDHATKNNYTLSHGFSYDPERFIDNTYHDFKTFEISVLPFEAAANPYTNFYKVSQDQLKGQDTMPLDARGLLELQKALEGTGLDINTIIKGGEKASAVIDGAAAYKADGPLDLVEDAIESGLAPEGEVMAEAEPEYSMKALYEGQKALMETCKAMMDMMSKAFAPPQAAPLEQRPAPVMDKAAQPQAPYIPPIAQSAPPQQAAINMPVPPAQEQKAANDVNALAERMARLEAGMKARYGQMQGDVISDVIRGFNQDGQKQLGNQPAEGAFDAAWFVQKATQGQG